MNNPICSKGAVRSQLHGIESQPIIYGFFEIIDNRKHTNSNKVFIDIDKHNKICTIGYSEYSTEENIENTVKWFNTNDNHKYVNNIASKGIGLKFFEFKLIGKWRHITYSEDKEEYIYTEMNTNIINSDRKDENINDLEFNNTLNKATEFIKYDEEIKKSEESIFKNMDNNYPFTPKTVFRCTKMNISNSFDEYKNDDNNGYNFNNLIKKMRIKYYEEIKDGFELYLKLPGYENFIQIKSEDSKDIIGTTNKSDELKIDLFIDQNKYLGYFLRIKDKYYKLCKNGNSILREEIFDIDKEPDFELSQFKNNLNKNDIDKYIIGNSIEKLYTGLHIKIGGTFISDQSIPWSIDKRNMPGASQFRSVLTCLSNESKNILATKGLKALFDMTTMKNLSDICKQCAYIYKSFLNTGSDDPNKYVTISSTNKRKENNKTISGYIYVIKLSDNFYKVGKSSDRKRIWDYTKESEISKIKSDFKDEDIDFYEIPNLVFLTLKKIDDYNTIEQEILTHVNDSNEYTVYYNKKGSGIREYFSTNNWNNVYEFINDKINPM